MDGPYERRNDSIRHLKGVLQRSPFIRAEWGSDGTRVSMLMDTGAEINLTDESVLTSRQPRINKVYLCSGKLGEDHF